jgi:hypothetical protein
MTPLFGHKDDDPADDGAFQAEVDRLASLPLPQLASEVMTKGFGPGAPGDDPNDTVTVGGPNINAGTTIADVVGVLVEGFSTKGADQLVQRLRRLVAEALQALEHASLIRVQLHTEMGALDFAITRLGRAAVEQGAVDRILGGGTL